MIDDLDCARIRNEIKKNKAYHLAHTEARFLLKILHISRLHRFILTPRRKRDGQQKNSTQERDMNTKIIIANCKLTPIRLLLSLSVFTLNIERD